VFEHVQAQRAIERAVGKRQRHERAGRDADGGIVGVEAAHAQPGRVFLDQDAFAAAGVEDARA
jgi:hypothetical protein